MPDMNERLDGVEQTLTALTEHVKEQFVQVDQRFAQIDQQFAQVDQRFAQIDQRFAQIDQRFAQIDQRFAQVDQRFDTLETRVQKLQVLEEENATQIKKIAEVQGHHGKTLKQLVEAVAPLKDLRDFVKRVADDHEVRIRALENATATSRPTP